MGTGFDVNYFGQTAVTQQLLPFLINGKGRVINISSVGGTIAIATYGPYGGSKFALERSTFKGLADQLRTGKHLASSRGSFAISCWHANDGESEAMWKIYTALGSGASERCELR